jgi:phage terminase Nu1 subunit (DNA packaging protein)
MDHLADLVESPLHARTLRRVARDTAEALDENPADVEQRFRLMLERHAEEWRAFRKSLGERSFVAQLASARP